MIYFIQSQPTGHIKIGYAGDDLYRRISQLQCGNPIKLEILLVIPGSEADEKLWQGHFSPDHHFREWFKPSESLNRFIEQSSKSGKDVRPPESEQDRTLREIEKLLDDFHGDRFKGQQEAMENIETLMNEYHNRQRPRQ